MKYNRRARLNTSQVRDTRRGGIGGRGAALGGGGLGIVGVLVYLLVAYLGGSGGSAASVLGQLAEPGGPATADNTRSARSAVTVRTPISTSNARWSRTSTRSRTTGRPNSPTLGTRYAPARLSGSAVG